jgi:hypothetical protein
LYQHSIQSKIALASCAGVPVVSVEQLALQSAEEALGDAVVKAVADGKVSSPLLVP